MVCVEEMEGKVDGSEAIFKADRLKQRSAVLLPAAAALCASFSCRAVTAKLPLQ